MNYVEDLVAAYGRFVALPWPQSVAPAERVWMAVYPPKFERRVRLNIPEFANETVQAGHTWGQVDVTQAFEQWMAAHEYAEFYFESPHTLLPALPAFFDELAAEVRLQLKAHPDPDGVVCLIGVGSLFGLGDRVKVSSLVKAVNESIAGRLLVLFPGSKEVNSWRLLDARDGWDYRAVAITAEGAKT